MDTIRHLLHKLKLHRELSFADYVLCSSDRSIPFALRAQVINQFHKQCRNKSPITWLWDMERDHDGPSG